IADGLLRLENGYLSVSGENGRRGQPRDPASDHDDVAEAQLDEPVSLSFTTLPPCVRRMALTISSSSGSTRRFCSLSQKADKKLKRLRAKRAEASAARLRAR